MGGGTPADQTAAGGPAVALDAAAPVWATTLYQTLQQQGRDERARHDEMQQQVSRLVAAELEREERAESRRERTSGYDPEDWSSGYGCDNSTSRSCGSSDSSASNLSDYGFVPVRESNPHWGARALAAAQDDEPKRHNLYGNKAFDSLCSGRHERGGTLGWSLEYSEAISLHMYSANDDLRDIISHLGRGRNGSGGDRGGGSPRGGSGARRDTAREARRGGASRGGRHDRRDAGADDGGASSSDGSF